LYRSLAVDLLITDAMSAADENVPILKRVEKVGGLAVIISGQVILLKSTVRYFRTAKKLTLGEVYPTNKFGVSYSNLTSSRL
jgi:hypothetical protein